MIVFAILHILAWMYGLEWTKEGRCVGLFLSFLEIFLEIGWLIFDVIPLILEKKGGAK